MYEPIKVTLYVFMYVFTYVYGCVYLSANYCKINKYKHEDYIDHTYVWKNRLLSGSHSLYIFTYRYNSSYAEVSTYYTLRSVSMVLSNFQHHLKFQLWKFHKQNLFKSSNTKSISARMRVRIPKEWVCTLPRIHTYVYT